MTATIYLESLLDGNTYCKTNGQFSRHLRNHGLTYQDYYETYVLGYCPTCACGSKLTLYTTTNTYPRSCGKRACVGKITSEVKKNWTPEQRKQDSDNKKAASAAETPEKKQSRKDKCKETNLKNHGVEWTTQSEVVKIKAKKTKLDRHGDENYNNSTMISATNLAKPREEKDEINEKRRVTNLITYGVENTCMLPSHSSKTNTANAKVKDYILPSGKIIGVRGYEPTAIDTLLGLYQESDILLHDDYSEYQIQVFSYTSGSGRNAKYYPDIYIPSENRIIEIKSQWWWDGNGKTDEKYTTRLANNLRKRQAVIDAGYNYEVWLYNSKTNYRVLKDDADFQTEH